MESSGDERVRIDQWLLAARLFKTRPFAQRACEGGKVSVNGQGVSAHRLVRAGDRVTVKTERGTRQLVVRGLGKKRLGPAEARELYDDVTPPPEPKPADAYADLPLRGERPSKRDRRRLDRFRGRD